MRLVTRLQIFCLESAMRTRTKRAELADRYGKTQEAASHRDQVRFYKMRISNLRGLLAA